MDEVTRGLNGCFVYVDDVLVATVTEDEHFALLERLFQRFLSYGEQSWRQARAREGEGCSRLPDPDNYKGATPLFGHAPLDALSSSKSQRIQLSPAERRALKPRSGHWQTQPCFIILTQRLPWP
uniref:Reverse transcriptase domain-containing protein n=1 Tax=Trichuris muris TaxID=70415 RepID=A0A5S6Q0B7_TRIMR